MFRVRQQLQLISFFTVFARCSRSNPVALKVARLLRLHLAKTGFLRLICAKVIYLVFFLLPACSQIDDYLLGADNTPPPHALVPVKDQVAMKLAWQVDLGGGKQREVDGKLVPVIQGNTIYIGLPGGRVEARDIHKGALRWSQALQHGLVSGPAVEGGVIAFGTNASSVVLLSQQTGAVLWEKSLSGQVLSRPVVSHGVVLVKTVDGNLYALKKSDGQRLWKAAHPSPGLILKASSSPLVLGNQLVFVGYSDGKTDVYELQTGHLVWQKGIAYANGASDVERLVDIDADPLAYHNMILLAAYQGEVGAVSLENGEFVWHKRASVYQNMVVGGGRLFMVNEGDIIWSLDPNNGQVNWQQDSLTARGLTSPVWMKGRLIVVDKMGWVHVLSGHDGSLIGRTSVNSSVRIAPVVSGNKVFVATQSGQLYCFVVTAKR